MKQTSRSGFKRPSPLARNCLHDRLIENDRVVEHPQTASPLRPRTIRLFSRGASLVKDSELPQPEQSIATELWIIQLVAEGLLRLVQHCSPALIAVEHPCKSEITGREYHIIILELIRF